MPGFKRLKDIDVASRSHFIRVYCWILFPLAFIMFFVPVSLPAKAAIILLGALAGTLVVVFITSAAGRSAGALYSGGGARPTLTEQLGGDLTRARVSKAGGNYADALATVETILASAPDFTEALFLKAQILWEGYGDGTSARDCVLQVLRLEQDKTAPVYRWAGELYKEIGKT